MKLWMAKGTVIDNYSFFREDCMPRPIVVDRGGVMFVANGPDEKAFEIYDISRLFPKLRIDQAGMKKVEILPLTDSIGYVIREVK